MSGSGEHKLIVAYLRRGIAHGVAEALHGTLGLDAFHYGHGRGAGLLTTIAPADMIEVDILTVVVEEDRAEEVFSFIHEAGGVDAAGGGLVIQAALTRAAALGLPLPPTGQTPLSG